MFTNAEELLNETLERLDRAFESNNPEQAREAVKAMHQYLTEKLYASDEQMRNYMCKYYQSRRVIKEMAGLIE